MEIDPEKLDVKPPDLREICTEDDSLTYQNFFHNYLRPNVPCVIKNVSKNWQCTQFWTTNNKPNFEYLSEKYGEFPVTIYQCDKPYFNSHETDSRLMSDYITYWKNYDNSKELNYLKDWHLKNSIPNDEFYDVPVYFSSDWLNEYCIENHEDDYRFVYMGPKGTWTPFHADVFNSYSWTVNVCGSKRWILFPKGSEEALKDNFQKLPFNVEPDKEKTKYFEFVQQAGDAFFVPSGWYHQVYNLEDTISINHNWINGCCIDNVWSALKTNFTSVKAEIWDCADMDNFNEHCQTMLKSVFAMDFRDFGNLLMFIGKKRLKMLEDANLRKINSFEIGTNHVLFDLRKVFEVLKQVVPFCESEAIECLSDCNIEDLLSKIVNKL